MSNGTDDSVLDAILRHNEGRKRSLVRRKLATMAGGLFPFYRGANELFAREWSGLSPLDPGPVVLLCGDLHLENFGAYLTDAGEARFSINDFDEAYAAPAALDLVRCGASILIAGEQWGLPVTTAAALAVEFLDHYRGAAAQSSGRDEDETAANEAIRGLLLPTAFASRDAVIERLTRPDKRKGRRLIRTGVERRRLRKKKREELQSSFNALTKASDVHGSIEVLDATTRVAGLGSLGLRRYLVLARGGTGGDRLRLLDVKEVTPSALRECVSGPQPDWGPGEASRVVFAERTILGKPESGLATIDLGGRSCRVREMIPDANRSRLSRLRRDPARLREAVRAAGAIAARAHARGAAILDHGRGDDLARWATGPAFDAILVASTRAADRTRAMYDAFVASIRRKDVRKTLGLPAAAAVLPMS